MVGHSEKAAGLGTTSLRHTNRDEERNAGAPMGCAMRVYGYLKDMARTHS